MHIIQTKHISYVLSTYIVVHHCTRVNTYQNNNNGASFLLRGGKSGHTASPSYDHVSHSPSSLTYTFMTVSLQPFPHGHHPDSVIGYAIGHPSCTPSCTRISARAHSQEGDHLLSPQYILDSRGSRDPQSLDPHFFPTS